MNFFGDILPSAISIATIFLFGSLGEILMEKSGHLNLGIPGIMCFGTLGGCIGVSIYMGGAYENPSYFLLLISALFFSALFSSIAGLIYAFFTVTLRSNQNVTGLVLTTFGGGIADYFMGQINKDYFSRASILLRAYLPFADNLGDFGKIFFGHGILVYLSIIAAVLLSIFFSKTRKGLNLRAIGENPATADAAGINVSKYKYVAIIVGAIIAGFGGLYYVMDFVGGSWENSATIQAFGWLAIALVIFSVWRPSFAIIGSIIFGLLYVLPMKISGVSFTSMQAFKLLPYIVTVVVLIFTSIFGKKNVQPPLSLGLPYFREER